MIGHFHFSHGEEGIHMQINGGCLTFCEDSSPAPCTGYLEHQTVNRVITGSSTEQRLIEAVFRFALEVTQILEVSKIITGGTK